MKCSAANPSILADLPSLVSFKLLRTSLAVIAYRNSRSRSENKMLGDYTSNQNFR